MLAFYQTKYLPSYSNESHSNAAFIYLIPILYYPPTGSEFVPRIFRLSNTYDSRKIYYVMCFKSFISLLKSI